MSNLLIIAAIALLWYGLPVIPAPFKEEVRNIVGTTAPWAPLLIGLYLLKDAVKALVEGVWRTTETALKTIVALLFFVVFLVFVLPVAVLDTILLGWMAQWMWKYQVGTLALVALSLMAISVINIYEGRMSYAAAKKYLVAAVLVGVGSIVWGYVSQDLTGTKRVTFRVRDKVVYSDPAASVRVKGGDRIRFTAFGRVRHTNYKGVAKFYSPQGDLEDLFLEAGDEEEHPRGELAFVVLHPRRDPERILVENLESGVSDIGGLDTGNYAGGYAIRGEATIPGGAEGRLSIGFYGLYPESGLIRLTLQLNPHRSLVGRMMELRDYVGVLGMLALGLGIVAALGMVMKLMPAGGMKGVAFVALFIAGYVFFIATVGAARRATGVDAFRSLGRLTFPTGVSARAGAGGGYEVVARVAPGRQENLARHVPAGARWDVSVNEGEVWLVRGGTGKPEALEGKGKSFGWQDPMILTGDGEASIWVRPKR